MTLFADSSPETGGFGPRNVRLYPRGGLPKPVSIADILEAVSKACSVGFQAGIGVNTPTGHYPDLCALGVFARNLICDAKAF